MKGGGASVEFDERGLRALVHRAAQADPDAWELLYRRNYSRLFAVARRRLPSDTAADDAVSETMLRALDRIPTFTWRGAGFDAWLSGILRNVLLESYRDRDRTRSSEAVPEEAADDDPTPLEALVSRDQHAHIRTAFARLSDDDQEVLELRVVAGLSADGVAAVTGRGTGAVRMAQSRALHRLRGHYEAVDRAD